jgi:uncharacterized membrane protein YfhO
MDADYPGWRVTVDGAEARLRRVNDVFKAVELPAGSHQVAFVFAPTRFRVGFAVSLVTCALAVGLLAATALRSRPRG